MKIALTILGQPASKANSRQLVKFGKRIVPIKSKPALAYEKAALLQIPASCRVMLTGPVRVTLRIWYASERPDLDESVVLDVLQARYVRTKVGTVHTERVLERAGVYVNDRQVREKHVYHGIDKANPRAEIEVEEIAPGLFDAIDVRIMEPLTRVVGKRVARIDPLKAPQYVPDGNPF